MPCLIIALKFDIMYVTLSIHIHSQPGSREAGVIYPDVIQTILQLRPVSFGFIIEQLCSAPTTCKIDIFRDVYRVTVIQINDIGAIYIYYVSR